MRRRSDSPANIRLHADPTPRCIGAILDYASVCRIWRAEESNNRYRYLLEKGTTGLSVAFDLPTQMGYDSDHPLAEGEVGKVGVAIDTLADMEVLFTASRWRR